MRRKTVATLAIALAGTGLVLLSCTNRPLIKVDPQTESYVLEKLEQTAGKPVDILVVVDNSLSMSEEQANLAEEFPLLIRSLLNPGINPETGKLSHLPVTDLHIGVISTDMGTAGYEVPTCTDPIDGDDGILLHEPSSLMPDCDTTYASYLSYLSEDPDVAKVEKMATDFGCVAVLGTDGCGFEQQLKAARKALIDHAAGANAGFLRPNSILTVLFVTDEEDCSVRPDSEEIFDVTRSDLGTLNLRCFYHPYMVQDVEEYVSAFGSLKEDPDDLVLAFLVGVPQVDECQGFGDEIPGCLELEDMRVKVDPVFSDRLAPSCTSSHGDASPARRFVQVAQQFGDNALVRSICADDFEPAIKGLTDKIVGRINEITFSRELETSKDEADPCLCLASCSIVEALADLRDCPADRPCFEPLGPGTGCTYLEEDGYRRTLCVIPQAGTRLSDCSLECTDPSAVHTVDGEGWYYLQYGENGGPQVGFTESMIPSDGSTVYIQCESMICPENRQCGPDGFEGSMCCDQDYYCDRSNPTAPTCMIRPD